MKLNSPNYWYKQSFLCYLLAPLSGLYRLIIAIRCLLYKYNIKKITKFNTPIIVVGNITVGGTGKTPLVVWLAEFLQERGFKPGIVSRGYSSHNSIYPCAVKNDSEVAKVGDEALLIAKRTHCPMVVAPNRVAAVEHLLETYNCDVVISDDGLQHYALGRDIEIVVVDAERRFGNGFCLPAGPLREPIKRLQKVDLVIENGVSMQLNADILCNIIKPTLIKQLSDLKNTTVHAVAGIGNPQRFFNTLNNFGINVIEHPFPDHYDFSSQDISFSDELMVLMTEKDAVKCQQFVNEKYWYVPINAKLDEKLVQNLLQLL